MSGCGCDGFVDSDGGFVGGADDGGGGNPNCCGTLAMSIWDTPATPNANDEEFDTGSSLAAAWATSEGAISATAIDPYAGFAAGDSRISVNTRRASWYMVQPQSGQTLAISKLFVPSATYAAWFRGSFSHRTTAAINNDQTLGLILTENPYDTADRLEIFLNESDAAVIQVEFQQVVGGVVTSIGTTANKAANDQTVFEGCLIQRTAANTYHGWALTNNGSALFVGTTTTFTPTIGRIGLKAICASVAAPGNMIVGFDFLRVVDGAVFLP